MRSGASTIARPPAVPHYHVVPRQGYTVWTYTHPDRAPRQIRLLTERLFVQGHRPLILRCVGNACLLYDEHLSEEVLRARIDVYRLGHGGYVQIAPAPE